MAPCEKVTSKKKLSKQCQLTPENYHERDAARVASFRGKKYSDATIKTIERVSRFWQR
jgi:predicted RNase H-like nuclease (RuvC/YqgF family)